MYFNGTKSILVTRLQENGVLTKRDAELLASDFDAIGSERVPAARSKRPNWTAHERARLCHVIADPIHAAAVAKLYNGVVQRVDLDNGIHDPWSAEFSELFNSDEFKPTPPLPQNDITESLLISLNPRHHPYERSATFSKNKWAGMRSAYSVAKKTFDASGQGMNDILNMFTKGDPVISYLHCFFFGLPCLEAIFRAIPTHAQAESGIGDMRAAPRSSAKKAKQSRAERIQAGLDRMASSLSAPIQITFSDHGAASATVYGAQPYTRKEVLGVEKIMEDTVDSLMNLEYRIRKSLKTAVEEHDSEYEKE